MSIDKTKLTFINKRKINEEQVKVESIFAPSEVSQVLWVEAQPVIENVDPLTKEASFAGQVMFFVTYLDNENKIQSFETNVPFLNKFIDESILPTTKLYLTPSVQEANFEPTTNKLEAVISISGEVYNQNEMEFMCGGDDNVCVKLDELSTQELIKEDVITLTESLSYPITDKMDTILRVNSKVCIKSVVAENDLFTVSGEINTCVKYLTVNEDMQKIMTTNFSEPFKREIEATGLTPEGCVELFAKVKNSEYKYEIDKEANRLVIDVPIEISFRAYDTTTLPSIADAFSLTNNIEITTSSFTATKIFTPEFFESKIEGSVSLDSEAPRIDKIVGFSNANLSITDTYTEDGKVIIEGVISFNLAYLNDEMGGVTTTKQEIPFKVAVELENQNLFTVENVSNLVDVEIVARRGREIFLDGKLKTMLKLSADKTDAVITDITESEELPAKTSAIEIYFGKAGDTLWDIAKELRTKPEVITAQNPDTVLPLEQAENIVVYAPKTR